MAGSQTVALILQNKLDAERVEAALNNEGLYLKEVRPSVFHVSPIPVHLQKIGSHTIFPPDSLAPVRDRSF